MNAATATHDEAQVTLRRGALYLPSALYAAHFDGVAAVVLIGDGEDLWILPVRHVAAGGYVLKVRNAAGDRVVDAPDFLRHHGLADEERAHAARWSEERAGLVLFGVLQTKFAIKK